MLPIVDKMKLLFLSAAFALCAMTSTVSAQAPKADALFDDEGLPRVVVGPMELKRDRVAVPKVRCDGAGAVCKAVTLQLRRNLELSTFFEVLNDSTFVANLDKETLSDTNWPDWFNVGAAYLVKGKISGGGPYTVQLRFYNVLDKKNIKVAGQTHKGVAKKDVHSAVNKFINGVIGALTGTPGIFGSHIVYAAKTSRQTRGIGIMEMDGHGKHGVAGGGTINLFPHFTSGGGVSYTSFRAGKPDIWVGGKKLTKDPWHYRGASWSSTGRLAASLSKGYGSHIYLLSSGGKIIKRLTRGGSQNVSPTWSPDGSQIAFVSDRGGGPQIYVMSASGGGASRVTMAGGYNSTPDWGPNGLIVFSGATGGGYDIFTTSPGGGMTRITQDQGTNKDPCWSPDGRYIAFVSRRKGHGNKIWLSSADGRWQFPVSNKGSYSMLKWGP